MTCGMSKLAAFIAFTAIALAPACKSKADRELSDLKAFRDRMCECTDLDCVIHVEGDQMTAELAAMKSQTLGELAKKRDPGLEKERAETKAAETACADKVRTLRP